MKVGSKRTSHPLGPKVMGIMAGAAKARVVREKKRFKNARARHLDNLDKGLELFTRGFEVFAVLSSLFWGVEAFALVSRAIVTQEDASTGAPHKVTHVKVTQAGRSLSSLAVPVKKTTATVEFKQFSHLNELMLTKFQPLPLTFNSENSALTFKQSPFYAQPQFEVIRFSNFWNK